MSAPYSTLLVDLTNWDLVLDSNGNIALAAPPYAVAQDVASAIKTFLNEVYYDSTLGVPWLQQILGQTPPLSVFKAAIVAAALSVPSVVSATCVIESIQGRQVTGQVQFTTSGGQTQTIGLGLPQLQQSAPIVTGAGEILITGAGSEIVV